MPKNKAFDNRANKYFGKTPVQEIQCRNLNCNSCNWGCYRNTISIYNSRKHSKIPRSSQFSDLVHFLILRMMSS